MTDHEVSLIYPLIFFEGKRRSGTTSYSVVYSRTGFITFSRLPEKGQFTKGKVFDAGGNCFSYDGECGWPRFHGGTKVLLEALLLPSIVAKVFELSVYFGPKVSQPEFLNLDDFKDQVIDCLAVFETKDLEEARGLILGSPSYEEVIVQVDWFRFHGGRRDEDGHPI